MLFDGVQFAGAPIGEGFESGSQLLDDIAKGQGIYSKGGAHILVSWGYRSIILGDWCHNENCWHAEQLKAQSITLSLET